MVVCRYFQQGYCRFGDNCRNEHPREQRSNSSATQNRYGALQNLTNNHAGGTNSRKDTPYSISIADIKKDANARDSRPKWILSAYGPGKDPPASLLEDNEYSFEEVRLRYYELQATGKVDEADREAGNLWAKAEQGFNEVLNNAGNVSKFMEDAEKKHPNRLDFTKVDGTKSRDQVIKEAEASNSLGGSSVFGQAGAFDKPATTFGQPTPSSGFGQPAQPSSFGQLTPPSGFGQPVQPSSFGRPLSGFDQPAASTFGKPSTGFGQSAFGQPAQPVFGQPTAQAPVFGQPANPAPVFGQATPQASAFGQPAPQVSAFGQPAQPSSTFGKPSLGSSGFGQPSTLGTLGAKSPFGAPSAATGFGQPSQSTTAFGQPSQPTSAFGQPAQVLTGFGQPTQPSTGFGQPAQPLTGFGQPTQPSTGFGQPAQPLTGFGQPAQSSPFGQPSQSSPFGQPSQSSPFSQAANTSSGFAQPTTSTASESAPTPAFGAPSTAPTAFGQPPSQPNNPFGVRSENKVADSDNAMTSPVVSPVSRPIPGSNPFGVSSAVPGPAFGNSQAPRKSSVSEVAVLPPNTNSSTTPHPLTNKAPRPLHYTQTLPASAPTVTNPRTGEIQEYRGRRVRYVNDNPCYERPDGKGWERIWFPQGSQTQDVVYLGRQDKVADLVADEERYTEEVIQQFAFLLEMGSFKDGKMPSVPPKREWCLYDF